MSVRYIDGFEDYATADLFDGNWNYRYGTSGLAIVGTGRNGGSCLETDNGFGTDAAIVKVLDNQETWVVGFAYRMTGVTLSRALIFQMKDAGTTQLSIYMNTDGTLQIQRGTSTVTGGLSSQALTINTWQFIEIKVTIANSIAENTCVLRVDGNIWATVATGQDMQVTANATANGFSFGCPENAKFIGLAMYFDDLYILDGVVGAVAGDNDFLGDVRVDSLLPDGAGSTTSWTPDDGDNYDRVNEATPDGDTTYVTSSTVDQVDSYTMGDLVTTPSKIWAVQTGLVARKTDAGLRSIAPVLRGTDGDKFGTTQNIGDDYFNFWEVHEQNPLDTPEDWTETTVNSIECGIKLIA